MTHKLHLQIVRGLSVVAVIFYHLDPVKFSFGYIGVDVFFALSGFLLIPKIYEEILRADKPTLAFLNFLHRRALRLLPAVSIFLPVVLVASICYGNPNDHQGLIQMAFASVLGLSNLVAYNLLGDYFQPINNPILHTWSLSAEEQCYILLPGILVLIFKTRPLRPFNSLYLITFACLALTAFGNLDRIIFSHIGISNAISFTYYSPHIRLAEFCLGGLVAFFNDSMKNRIYYFFLIIPMLLILNKGFFHLGLGLISALIISALVFQKENIHIRSKILSWLGDKSYSIYLYHLPVLYFCTIYLTGLSRAVIYFILTLVLGGLSRNYVEIKFRKFIQKTPKKHFMLLLIYPITMIVITQLVVSSNYFGKLSVTNRPEYAGLNPFQNKSFIGETCVSFEPCFPSTQIDEKVDILLIGDSHAEMFSKAIFEAAKLSKKSLAIWTTPGCRITFETKANQPYIDGCNSRNLKLFSWIKKNRPRHIILSQAVYANSNLSEMKRGLYLLSELSGNILLISEVPVFPDNNTFMVDRALFAPKVEYKKDFPLTKMDKTHIKSEKEFINYAKNLGIDTLKVSKYFCDSQKCTRFSEGQWLYFDTNHVSVFGAKRLIRELVNWLI